MSQAPVEEATTRGFEPPRLTQYSVFLENRVGRLLDLMDVFNGQALTLAGLSILDSTDHAVVRIITSNALLASRLLGRHGMTFSESEVLAVEIASHDNFANVCQHLLQVEVNIQYAYPLIVRPRQRPVFALHTDDNVFAGQILRRRLYTLLCENDLGDNATGNTPDATGGLGDDDSLGDGGLDMDEPRSPSQYPDDASSDDDFDTDRDDPSPPNPNRN